MNEIFEKNWSQKWFQFILDHLGKKWDWSKLSLNPNLSWETVLAYRDQPWNWIFLTLN